MATKKKTAKSAKKKAFKFTKKNQTAIDAVVRAGFADMRPLENSEKYKPFTDEQQELYEELIALGKTPDEAMKEILDPAKSATAEVAKPPPLDFAKSADVKIKRVVVPCLHCGGADVKYLATRKVKKELGGDRLTYRCNKCNKCYTFHASKIKELEKAFE